MHRAGRAGRRRADPRAAAARPGPGAHPHLRHPVHAQDADLAAPGLDDPRLRRGLPPEQRGGLPRGLHDPHLDLAQLPGAGLAGRGPPAGRAGGVRAGAAPGRAVDDGPRPDRRAPVAVQVLPGAGQQRPDPGPVPAVGPGVPAALRAGGHGAGLGHGRVRARPVPADHPDLRHRHRRRHLQARVPDGPLGHPGQQDLPQHRAGHDQHRHHPQLGGLPAGGADGHRGGPRVRHRADGPADQAGVRAPGQVADLGPPAAARFLRVPRRVPGQPGRVGPRRQHPQGLLHGLPGRAVRVPVTGAPCGTGWRPGSRWCRRSS